MDLGLGSLLGGIAGGVASIFGQSSANDANKEMAAAANAANSAEAQKNRDFQWMMSNTAHEREVADLKKAGLNPILSATKGQGASTPGGATATHTAARAENTLKDISHSALSAASISTAMKQTDSNLKLQAAQTAQSETTAELNQNSAKAAAEQANKTRQDTIAAARENKIKSGTIDKLKQAAEISADTDLKKSAFDNKATTYDSIMHRFGQATGAIGNVFGLGKFLGKTGEAAKKAEKWTSQSERDEKARQDNFKKADNLFRKPTP